MDDLVCAECGSPDVEEVRGMGNGYCEVCLHFPIYDGLDIEGES